MQTCSIEGNYGSNNHRVGVDLGLKLGRFLAGTNVRCVDAALGATLIMIDVFMVVYMRAIEWG